MANAVIFDLDGVLCYTDRLHYIAWKIVCDEYDLDFDETENQKLRGVSRLDCVDIILSDQKKHYDNFNKTEFASRKNSEYKRLLGTLSSRDIAPGAIETLIELRKRNIRLPVGSSSRNAPQILKQLDMWRYFDAVVDGSVLTKSKPAPEVFIRAADRLGVLCKDAIVVEDAVSGIDAAVSGGFITAGIGDALNSPFLDYKLYLISDLLDIGELG